MNISDLHGIDISSWQAGMSAFSLNSVDFAILKISEGQSWVDPQFVRFYAEANIPLGAYVYSHATTEAEAIAEAKKALELCAGKKLPLGIYMDVEESKQMSLSDSGLTAVVKAFCDEIKKGGFISGAYGSRLGLWAKVGLSYLGDGVIAWVAQWGSRPDIGDVWQFSSSDHVDGYNGNVDGNKVLSERFAQLVAQSDAPAPTPTPEPEPQGDVCSVTTTQLILRHGDGRANGKQLSVKRMQHALIDRGYSCGWMGADGDFGENTKIALHKYKKANGVDDPTVVCDSWTWKSLLEG